MRKIIEIIIFIVAYFCLVMGLVTNEKPSDIVVGCILGVILILMTLRFIVPYFKKPKTDPYPEDITMEVDLREYYGENLIDEPETTQSGNPYIPYLNTVLYGSNQKKKDGLTIPKPKTFYKYQEEQKLKSDSFLLNNTGEVVGWKIGGKVNGMDVVINLPDAITGEQHSFINYSEHMMVLKQYLDNVIGDGQRPITSIVPSND